MLKPLPAAAALAAGLAASASLALAAPAGAPHKATLQQTAFPPPVYQTVMIRTVVDPAGQVAPHTHPGVEMAYVVAGRARVNVAGRPPRTVSAGDTFSIPPQTVHSVVNVGPGPLTIVSTYVVDRNKPIASPAH